MHANFALVLHLSISAFVALVNVALLEEGFGWLLSCTRRHWTPIGLISSRLERLEPPTFDVIAAIEARVQRRGEFPIPLECSRGYLERLRRDRSK